MRLKDLTGLELRNIRKTYGKICKFVTGSKLSVSPPKNPLKQLNFNSNSKSKVHKSALASNYTSLKNFKSHQGGIKIIGEKKYNGKELKDNKKLINGGKNPLTGQIGGSVRKIGSSVTGVKRFDIENNPM